MFLLGFSSMLSDIFGVSIDEIIAGQRLSEVSSPMPPTST